jgi:L-2-hydroxyglutarate oxidase
MKSHFLIVGGGVVGLSIARELKMRNPNLAVTVLEKEPRVSQHASGRNSGVIHAGFYYSPESLKAKLTLEGNQSMKRFCDQNGISMIRSGKVVVARKEEDKAALKMLHERGIANGVEVSLVDESRLFELEPLAQTLDLALWSPSTAVADPGEVSNAILANLERLGVKILTPKVVRYLNTNTS